MGISIVPTFWLLKGCQELWYSIQGFVWTRVFSILGCIPRSGISGSYGNSMFNLLRNFWPVFQNDYTILHSNVQWMRVSISLHSRQRLLSSVFFYFVHCRRCELISHWAFGLPFLANDGEHLLCAYWPLVYLWRKCPFRPFLYFSIVCLLITESSEPDYTMEVCVLQSICDKFCHIPLKDQVFQNCPPKGQREEYFSIHTSHPPPFMFPRKVLAPLHFQDFHVWVPGEFLQLVYTADSGEELGSWSDVLLCVMAGKLPGRSLLLGQWLE